MAKNFQINAKAKGRNNLNIRLTGDFDGSAALELLDVIEKATPRYTQVAVETHGLRNVYSFGLEIITSKMAHQNVYGTNIVFTGRFRSAFSEG